MLFRKLVPFCILSIFITALFLIGCDTLVTENNTIEIFDSTIAVDCFDCHSDTDNILLRPSGQFANSAHANFDLLDVDGMDCGKACHTHEGFLDISTTAPAAINCYTCHLPHTGEYGEWQIDTLRKSDIDVISVTGFGADLGISNNCGHCHSAVRTITGTGDVNLDESFGPHYSPQADIVAGLIGNFVELISPLSNSHDNNSCIKCHYGTALGDGQGYLYGEHTFRLENDETGDQYVNTCNVSGCHSSSPLTDFYSTPKIVALDSLADTVQTHLELLGLLDPADSSGLTFLADSANNIQAKLLYNYLLYKHDNSRGIHNINFVTELLDTTKILLDSLPPNVDFMSDIQISCASDIITFTPIINGEFDTLIWSFGDATVDTSLTAVPVTKQYPTKGTFNVILTAISGWVGRSSTGADSAATSSTQLIRNNYITVDTVPVANFYTDDAVSICIGDTITFLDSSITVAAATFDWSFGSLGLDNTNSTQLTVANPEVLFDTIGTFTIALKTTTGCGVDSLIKTDHVTVDGAMAIINSSNVDTTYTFTSNSLGTIDSIQWDTDGDNIFETTLTPPFSPLVVEYPRSIIQLVQLQVFHPTCPPDLDTAIVNTN